MEDEKEEEKETKKPKGGKAGAELKGEPAADGLFKAKSEDAAESHVKGSKGEKPDKKSKKDKESLY